MSERVTFGANPLPNCSSNWLQYKRRLGKLLDEEVGALTPLSRVLDLACIGAGFFTTAWILAAHRGLLLYWSRGGSLAGGLASRSPQYAMLLAVSLAVWLMVAWLGGIYESHRGERLPFTAWLYVKWDSLWVLVISFIASSVEPYVVGRSFLRWFLLISLLSL